MEEKIMTLELSAEDPASGRYYYVSLELPVEGYEILDALQKIRVYDRDVYIEADVYKCKILPELCECRLDSPTVDELNFLAKRLAGDAGRTAAYLLTAIMW